VQSPDEEGASDAMKILLLLALAGCTTALPRKQTITDLHYEPDTGCGGGWAITICDLYPSGSPESCWTGDVRDLPKRK
jgi:hypothetical protein